MKLLKKVDRLQIKRCFVMTHYMRKFGIARKNDKDVPSRQKYLTILKKTKSVVDKLTEKQLDKIIGTYKKRIRAYNKMEWYIGEVSIKDVGVWRGAGGLPMSWTHGSLFNTARDVKNALKENSTKIKDRARRAIPTIIKLKSIIKKENHLFPILFEGGTGTNGRRKFVTKQKWDIDDGNMRSIAFAVSGDKKLIGYFGKSTVK